MGRTNQTYRQHLEKFFSNLQKYRRELRGENKKYFDSLEENAFKHAHAGSQLNSARPALPVLISIMVGLQQQIDQLEQRIEEVE